ncbi:hypothetical protein [Variovorax sp. MHTC-1]|uniref:hypothetical protein n=1 Tax=Variovorax sp. MHTC-1 TaxID=2495593 RepID=UPI000F88D9AA|nr:hypothetical protein [Variovorax sp. MHTC-1]RST55332.1 hypothetical protein EJI01_08055 [Variovorax sp. MHTC-1]
MRLARHPIRARTVLCVLALALWFATTLGLVHRTIHSPIAAPAHMHSVESVHAGEADHGSHGLAALFDDHSDADCRLYDQLSHGPAALCVPALLLPVMLPAATFAFLEGEVLARWVALFDARGPPSAR